MHQMKSPFTLITRHIENKDPIHIYLIADLHAGALEFMWKEWEAFTKKIMDTPNAYLITAGDMINNATRSSISDVFRETMAPSTQKWWLAEQLEPLAKKGKILAMTDGNHERRSEKDADINPMYDVAVQIGCEDIYRPDIAFLKLQFGDIKGNGQTNPTYVIAVTHGAGGGALTGSSVNKSEKASAYFDGIDVLVTAHTHKGHITKPAKYVVNKYANKVTRTHTVCIGCVSWLEWAGYAVRKLMPPAHVADPQHLILMGNKKEILTVW